MVTSEETVAAVLIRLEGIRQFLLYYISKVLQNGELGYSKIEKCIIVLIIVARKLWSYFQAHLIIVVTNQPMKVVLSKADTSEKVTS